MSPKEEIKNEFMKLIIMALLFGVAMQLLDDNKELTLRLESCHESQNYN